MCVSHTTRKLLWVQKEKCAKKLQNYSRWLTNSLTRASLKRYRVLWSVGLSICLFRSLSHDRWKSLIILWGMVLAQTCAHTEVTLSIAECWAAFPKTELLVAFSIFRITGSAAIEEVQTQPIASVLVGENNCRRQHAVYRSLLILEEAFVFL